MPYLDSLRKFLFKRRLKAFKTTNLHKVQEGHFKKIANIGVLFDATELDVRERIIQFAERQKEGGRRVKMLGFFNKKIDGISFSFPYFSLKDLNFAYIPKSREISDFVSEPFDVLICLDLQLRDPILYVSAASKAYFKIGPGSADSRFFDLMIETNSQDSLEEYIQTVKDTFNKIT